jgi:hypothetical protein
MMKFGEKNLNNRVYTESACDSACQALQRKIKSGNCFSCLGHGESTVVQPDKICAVVKSLTKKGNSYVGVSECISEGMGRVLRSIINAGGNLGHSTRSTATVVKNAEGVDEIQNDLCVYSRLRRECWLELAA